MEWKVRDKMEFLARNEELGLLELFKNACKGNEKVLNELIKVANSAEEETLQIWAISWLIRIIGESTFGDAEIDFNISSKAITALGDLEKSSKTKPIVAKALEVFKDMGR